MKTTSYRVFRDGVHVATTMESQYLDVGLTPGTQHTYSVAALDWAENSSAISNPCTIQAP